jgi:hypothetical protein
MAAADAFAMLWAQEQGEAVAAPSSPPAAELNEASLDLLAAKISDRVAELVTERLLQTAFGDELRRTVNQVAERIVRAEVERISAAVKSTRTP